MLVDIAFPELADMLGVSSSNAVLLHLRALERKNFIKLSRRVSRGISIVGRKEPTLAVQLLQEMIAEEPGARERAIEFLRLFGEQVGTEHRLVLYADGLGGRTHGSFALAARSPPVRVTS